MFSLSLFTLLTAMKMAMGANTAKNAKMAQGDNEKRADLNLD